MKLHVKLILTLLAGLLFCAVLTQTVLYVLRTRLMADLNRLTMAQMEAREWQSAQNIFETVGYAVRGSLERGEMEKFSRLLEEQRSLAGLVEFSLYSGDGVVTNSSLADRVGQQIPRDFMNRVLKSPTAVRERTADEFRIFQPLATTADCLRCHTQWQRGQSNGVLAFRFSAAALKTA